MSSAPPWSRKWLALTGLALLAGCASPPPFGGSADLQVMSASALPVPASDGGIDFDAYHISPRDTLEIGVFGIEGLEPREIVVDSGGQISFPLVGIIEAGGLTIAQLQAELGRRLSAAYVRDPQVTVNIKKAVDRFVTVDGQVMRPGSYPINGKMSLVRAVANAGSTTEFAKLQEVVVFREVAGQRYAAFYSLEAIRRGAYADPPIFAGDVIVVDDSKSRRLFKDLLQLAPLLTSPLVLLLQN